MAKSLHNYTVVEAQNAALGQAGSILIDDDAQHTGKFVAITAITESVVTTVSEDTSIWDTLTTLTLPIGVTIYGRWSSVQIASGDTAIVYRG